MAGLLLVGVSAGLVLQGGMTAGTGKPASRRLAPTHSPAAVHQGTKPGPLAYAIAVNPADPVPPARFGVLDIGSGMFHPIADLPNGVQGIGRDGEGRLYVVDTTNNLVRINPGNGKTDVIGSTGVTTPAPPDHPPVDVFASLATGELFLMDYSNNLYSVNRSTGAATLIGYTGIPPITSPIYSGSLAGDCENLFFTIVEVDASLNDILPPTLYLINPRTAVATLVGPTTRGIPGSGFIDGTLYGFSLDFRLFGLPEGPHVFSIDTATGAATAVADLNVPGVAGAVRLAGAQGGRCNAR